MFYSEGVTGSSDTPVVGTSRAEGCARGQACTGFYATFTRQVLSHAVGRC